MVSLSIQASMVHSLSVHHTVDSISLIFLWQLTGGKGVGVGSGGPGEK